MISVIDNLPFSYYSRLCKEGAYSNPQIVWSVQSLFTSDHVADPNHMIPRSIDIPLHRSSTIQHESQITDVASVSTRSGVEG